MRKTGTEERDRTRGLAVTTDGLRTLLGCGRDTAVKIGLEAESRIQIGKRVLWNVAKIQKYLDQVSGGV